jgi:hypothetical protein
MKRWYGIPLVFAKGERLTDSFTNEMIEGH